MMSAREPIAIVGIGCRFPGAAGLDELWQLLCDGRDVVGDVPADRFDIDAVHDPRPATPGRTVSRAGGFLEGIDRFDAAYFGISPREAAHMDPQQRLLLETAAEALQDAGLTRTELAGSRTGVFTGALTGNYWEHLSRRGLLDVYANLGTARSGLSGRLSHAFDLRGPSISVDTACSSSLVAVHLAVQSLRSGESDHALAAGVNVILSPAEAITFSQAGMLAADGRCKFASKDADGFVRSEGVGVVVLKTLSRAIRDGDAVHAVILGSAVRNDGSSGGAMMTPAVEGQVETLRAAYADAGVEPGDVGYVEAHGTGTPAGDPVEVAALARVLGDGRAAGRPLVVGSIKSNIGHAESAAGMAGLLKAVLCVRHRHVPASLHAEELTPEIDWAGLPVEVARTGRAWPGTGRAVAGVSSVGISGTDAHCVVTAHVPDAGEPPAEGVRLLALSARTRPALLALAGSYVGFLEPGGAGHATPLADVCATAGRRRDDHQHRMTVVGTSHAEMAEKLRAFLACRPARGVAVDAAPAAAPVVVFVFPGQGAQWVGMARDLRHTAPAFAAALAACDEAVRAESGWSPIEALDGELDGIDRVQPTLWAIEVALAAQWSAWGVHPDVVVGHSMGEVAAACAAGALTLADGAAVICRRSALLRRIAGHGAMLSVDLPLAEAEAAVAGRAGVSVAVSNSAGSTVLAGDPVALDEIAGELERREVFRRRVNVDVASHSPQVDVLRDDLLAALSTLEPATTTVRMVSTVDGVDIDGAELDADYWARNLRLPVRFGAVVRELAAAAPTVVVEMSPHPVLAAAVQETLDAAGVGLVVGCTRRDEPEQAALLESLAAVHRAGVAVDWAAVNPGRHVRLPGYPWQRERHWFTEPAGDGHPLLSGVTRTGERSWQGRIDLSVNTYLVDHRVQDTVVLPGTACAELVLAACDATELRDVAYHRAIHPDVGPELRLTLAPDGTGFVVESRLDDGWTTCVTGSAHTVAAARRTAPAELCGAMVEHVTGAEFYRRFAAEGNQWLGAFRGIGDLWRGEHEAVARIDVTPATAEGLAAHAFHPAVLDACGQVLAAAVDSAERARHGATFVLGGIDVLRIHDRPHGTVWSHAVRTDRDEGPSFCGDVTVTDEDGRVLAEFVGLRLRYLDQPGPGAAARGADGGDTAQYEVRWRHTATPAPAPAAGHLLVLTDDAGLGARLAEHLGPLTSIVTPGPVFEAAGEHRYRIDPDDPAQFHAVVEAAERAFPGVPCRAVHVWGAGDAEDVSGCTSALHLAVALHADTPLWLVTREAQQLGAEPVVRPGQSALWGLGRTLAQECTGRRVTLVDLPADADPERLAREITAADDGENQIALRPGGRFVARLVRAEQAIPTGPAALRTTAPGLLDDLGLRTVPVPAPGPGEVLVRVGHAGVNYRDVLMATGCYPGQEEEVELGWECAGTVAAVGDGVAGLPLGARVLAAAPASLGTHVVADARLVHPYPDRLSEAEAAGVPIAYLTAYYGLHVLGRLREGERVLVHSATGGVGLAAIRIARWRGAEVFATAGSSEKRAWLRMIGVQHVGDSRTTEFATEILAATRGHGVDVVLNTLAGAAIEANLAVLAPYGRHIDLARRDIVDNSPLGLAPLAKHLTLTAFDVTALLRDRPAEAGEALAHVLALIGAGVLDPVPHETRPVDRAPEAFRRIAAAQHTGKIVLDLNGATARSPHVRPDGTYLVTGGHGGLGREVSRWLLDSGARHVVLLGRTASTEPEPAGVSYEALDVADTDALRALLRRRAEAGLPALRGVVHAAGVIDYTPLDELTGARLSEVLHPKVAGGWALHRATDGAELDFFVLFSSGAAVLGSPRLGAYAAANAFLDGLARRRRLAGLPATSVGWGFWSGTGMVHRYEREHGRSLVPSGFGRFDAATGFTHLRTLLDRDAVQAAVLTADWPRWAAAHPDAARDPLLRELLLRPAVVSPAPEPVAPAPVPLRTPTPAGDVLTGLVGAIATVMSLPPDQLDLDRPLNSQGFDSLMAGQVRAAVRRDLGVLLPITRMLSGRSVRDLASGLRDGLAPPDPGEA